MRLYLDVFERNAKGKPGASAIAAKPRQISFAQTIINYQLTPLKTQRPRAKEKIVSSQRLRAWPAAASAALPLFFLLLFSAALLFSAPAAEGLALPSAASLTAFRLRLQSSFSPQSSPPSRVIGDNGAQVDVPFDYSYFNKFLTSDCSPAFVDA